MKLIEDWKTAYRYLTVQLAALLTLLAGLYEYFPQAREYLDPAWIKYVGPVLLIARVIQQSKPATANQGDPAP